MLGDLVRTVGAIVLCWALVAAVTLWALSPMTLQWAWAHPRETTLIGCSMAFVGVAVAALAFRRRHALRRSKSNA